jgi:aconitate hydratase
MDLQLLIF